MVAMLEPANSLVQLWRVLMGTDPAEHERPSIILFLRKQWATLLPLLKNKWTLQIFFGLLKFLFWIAKKFDWL